MERLKEKSNKQENSLTIALRTIIKQKEETANKYKLENQQLQSLLLKQQNLLNKLNQDNLKLSRKLQELKATPESSDRADKKKSNNIDEYYFLTKHMKINYIELKRKLEYIFCFVFPLDFQTRTEASKNNFSCHKTMVLVCSKN